METERAWYCYTCHLDFGLGCGSIYAVIGVKMNTIAIADSERPGPCSLVLHFTTDLSQHMSGVEPWVSHSKAQASDCARNVLSALWSYCRHWKAILIVSGVQNGLQKVCSSLAVHHISICFTDRTFT